MYQNRFRKQFPDSLTRLDLINADFLILRKNSFLHVLPPAGSNPHILCLFSVKLRPDSGFPSALDFSVQAASFQHCFFIACCAALSRSPFLNINSTRLRTEIRITGFFHHSPAFYKNAAIHKASSVSITQKGAYRIPEYAPLLLFTYSCYSKFCHYFIKSLTLTIASYCKFSGKIHAQNT